MTTLSVYSIGAINYLNGLTGERFKDVFCCLSVSAMLRATVCATTFRMRQKSGG